ncbi:hypothetical protein CISIN_1g041982mg [Citrus sinensis]|uniref:Uncharacterized protein n=1 Tax=Citrus sinensis TaxID=2711 RepID=A0A067E6R5_CITSI|nr:hypothetical protein CISIN_1g041982mg [Citrus sinensis]
MWLQNLVMLKFEDGSTQPPSADDLFGILGLDFKDKLLNANWNYLLADEQHTGEDSTMSMNAPELSAGFYSVKEGILQSSSLSGMGTNHLFEAVVSRANFVWKQISDDNVSYRTTLTQISSSSIPTNSLSTAQDNGGNCSQTTSICGSHISSWVEQGQSVKRDGSVSTTYSEKNDETAKSNSRRLNLGEKMRAQRSPDDSRSR